MPSSSFRASPHTRGWTQARGRRRGDTGDGRRRVASPHTRGWTHRIQRPAGCRSGFPAHAGMDPSNTATRTPGPRLPRTRGDGPLRVEDTSTTRRGFPAHAGMDPRRSCGPCSCRGLPRTRGDGPFISLLNTDVDPASPHTRGWTRHGCDTGRRPSGFPAHAGMDRRVLADMGVSSRLPRTRGDGPT